MAVFLLKLVFSILSALSNMATRLIFTTAAHVAVQMIQALKVPGERSQRILDHVKSMITTCMEWFLNLAVDAITSALSSVFDFVKEGVFSSSSGLTGAVAGLLEKSRTSLDEALKDIPEVLEAFSEMVGKIITDFLSNCSDAVAYVTENVLK
ncbi:hypothetical protein C2S52_009858 [Perilla frutescens var. hirtella]|nr:hypothetical protein C2S52_009858 [Perilla frutescens var. hirtella]